MIHEDLNVFPEVPVYSGEHCYRNGVSNLYKITFTPYEQYTCGPEACAHKLSPIDFDPSWLEPDAELPTPAMDATIALQGWDEAEAELLMAMLGRMTYPVRRLDRWQSALFLTGVGGSGKTTLTTACSHCMYATSQIGFISNTIEKNFPFESLTKMDMAIATDIDESLMLKLSQTDLHKIINGEEVEINVKHGGRRMLKWHTVPLCLVANVVPNWKDDQGQMACRVVYFDFSKKPPLANTALEDVVTGEEFSWQQVQPTRCHVDGGGKEERTVSFGSRSEICPRGAAVSASLSSRCRLASQKSPRSPLSV